MCKQCSRRRNEETSLFTISRTQIKYLKQTNNVGEKPIQRKPEDTVKIEEGTEN